MIFIRVTMNNGDELSTGFNGTYDEAFRYYMGQCFNLGDTDWGVPDKIVKAIAVHEIDAA